MPAAPAVNGATARTSPTKRPIRIALPPWRSRKPSTWCRRACVMPNRGPRRSRNGRPSRRPSRKLARSPSAAALQATAIITGSETSPWAATTPPSTSAVSPGAISPTNAPVSRNAMPATSAYVHGPSVCERSSSAPSTSGSSTTPAITRTSATAAAVPAAIKGASERCMEAVSGSAGPSASGLSPLAGCGSPYRSRAMPSVRLPYELVSPLRTARLVLRHMSDSDVDDIHAYQSREDVCRYLPYVPRTREEVAAEVAQFAEARLLAGDGDPWQLAIERAEAPGRVIGDVSFELESVASAGAEIGWSMHPGHYGHGYMTEAAGAVLEVAFG